MIATIFIFKMYKLDGMADKLTMIQMQLFSRFRLVDFTLFFSLK